MKNIRKYRAAATLLLVLPAAMLLNGCSRDNMPSGRPKVEVVINGGIGATQHTRGQIVPDAAGLPSQQLDVSIVTVNFSTTDPANIQPGLAAWSGSTADITRGYFGGPGIGAPGGVTNGEIKYTSEDGTAVQKLFYEENGEYYFVRVVYPYDGNEFIQTGNGAAVVFSGINGSQDIMCSNLGWGNIDYPEIETNDIVHGGVVLLGHMLSLFRITLEPENAEAADLYGEIRSVKIINQPGSIKVDMIDLAVSAYSEADTDYPAEGFAPTALSVDGNSDPVRVDAGYIMVMPGQKFTIEAETEKRLILSTEIDFATLLDPYLTSAPGTIYDIRITFMEAYEMKLVVEEAKEWWMDSEFD